VSTRERTLDAALASFSTRGYEATSLDALAAGLGVRKQTILYYFPSKEALLDAVIDRGAAELSDALDGAVAGAGPGFAQVEAVVRSVFRLAGRRPELLPRPTT
jgi:AcrR family transcriptional regulator